MFPVVVVHGGAGHIPKARSENSTSGVRAAARTGYTILREGGSSMDAVVEAVTQLENNPSFNAGCGSVLNVKGEVEMDAIVMDGKTLGSGAVSAVRNIANPIQLARLVMDKTAHACLTAEGANQFARSMGVPEVPLESLITDYSRMRWKKNLEPDANPVECQMGKMGTVGAVAVDSEGNVACATSTGGMLNKMEGRVGDTPCIGQSSSI
ncbi:isoaspartyl peptidase/L-asparaginase [Etheostoma spectabile]|uniref:isoaspartyl peptidase/L-asparaginase n=1 Tax=Etheostoma spectabile TaxID=54343 RepID=UPI0013AF4D9C|nr:isoaspartyl peptidase/L-asparaginase [Etheostoma spectabile]